MIVAIDINTKIKYSDKYIDHFEKITLFISQKEKRKSHNTMLL